MQIEFKEARWSVDSAGEWLCLKVNNHKDAVAVCEMVNNKPCAAEITHKKNKRSLDANAYAWVLFGKLAAAMGIPKEEIYRQLVKDIGDNFTIVPVREDAVNRWCELWAHNGVGWFCENIGKCKRTEGYFNLMCYHGSSTYDTRQMSRLVDAAVELCKEYGIETMPPNQLESLKGAWQ